MRYVTFVLCATIAASMFVGAETAQAQERFYVDWLFLDRTNDTDGQSIVGPDSTDLSDAGFDMQSGFRVGGVIPIYDYELSGSYMQIDDWQSNQSGTLVERLSLDGEADGAAVFGPGVIINSLAAPSAIRDATHYFRDSGVPGDNEQNEAEFLRSGAFYQFDYNSRVYSFDLTVKQGRQCRDVRWGIGYRHLNLSEGSLLTVSGELEAVDLDDGALDGDVTNEPNDGISHNALVQGGGYQLIDGPADGFDGFRVATGTRDTLLVAQGQTADNRLDGVQFTLDALLYGCDAYTLEFVGTSGLYHNSASGVVSDTVLATTSDDSIYTRAVGADRNTASYIGSIGLRSALQVTDYIRLRAGYEVLGIAGVALAPEQVHGVSTDAFGNRSYNVETGGAFVAHGGSLGLELSW